MKRLYFACLIVFITLLSGSSVFAGKYPFPINKNYTAGIRVTNFNAASILSMYNTWKSRYVVTASPGQRVISPEVIMNNYDTTVSEGQAYGMLLAVYFDDQTLFNNLWAYKVAKTTAAGKASGLMPWVISSGGTVLDSNSASDADFDIAFALLMASVQWGDAGVYNYANLAATEIMHCRQYDISSTDFHVKPGDGWDDWSYPSYYFPAYFRVFAEVDSAPTTWNNAIAKVYTNMANNRNSTSGLVGEICNADGSRRTDNPCGAGCDGRIFKYNSCRVPFRFAMDYVWNGAALAGTQTSMNASFFNGISPANVKDGYYISGNTVEGAYNNAAFVGPAGCSLMYSSTYASSLATYYSRTSSFSVTESYYNGTLQLLTILLMTGNFHNLRNAGAPLPTNTPTTPPTSQLLDDFEDFMPTLDTQNNWGGYWYTWESRANLGAGTNVWPGQGAFLTMTAGGSTGDSTYYLKVTGTKAAAVDPNYPSVGIGTELAQDAQTLGLSVNVMDFYNYGAGSGSAGGVMFDVKGDGTTSYKIALNPKGSETLHPDSAYYEYTFIPPSTWTHLEVAFNMFTQPTWSSNLVPIATVLSILQKLQWQNGANTAMTFNLSLDNVGFYPYIWPPTPIPTSTPTLTPSRTATFTQTPVFGPSELLDDCNDGNGTNNWGGPWYTYNDASNSGTSYVVPIPGGSFNMQAPGAATTSYAARITAVVTDVYANGYVGIGTGLSPLMASDMAVNCTGFTGIRFYVKVSPVAMPIDIKLKPKSTIITGSDDYKYRIVAPTTWTQVQLFFTEFTQEGWGTTVTLANVKSNLLAVAWQSVGQPWPYIDLWVDQVEMFPSQGWTPTRTPSPSASMTSTRTPSPSASPTSTASPTATPSRTYTGTNTATPTGTSTGTATGTNTASPTGTNTNTPLPTSTYTGTRTVSPTSTSTSTGTPTRTGTPTSTSTATPTYTGTLSSTPTVTPTFTISQTHTVSPTFTEWAGSPTDTPTSTATPSATPTFTATGTLTRTGTPTSTSTLTSTDTSTSTPTGTFTMANSPTSTFTTGPSFTFTVTPEGTLTNTPIVSATLTVTSTSTATPTYTDTPTFGISMTDTFTPTETNTIGLLPTNTVPAGSCLLDNMDDNDNDNAYGGFWYSYTGGTPATVSPASGE
ncbi:MAG: hypothetical protein LLG37_08290, partial [Spirochaetia bacterium]|nr:hypothetical protein [Spirochaetia bacterium]